VKAQTEKYSKSIHLVNESNNEKNCKANQEDKMNCDDDCNGDWIAKTNECKSAHGKKVEVRKTKDGKGSGIFAMEDIEKDEYIIEYVGKREYKRTENNYVMKINGMNSWINRNKNGGPAQYINHSCNPNCELVQWGVEVCHISVFLPRRR
jgi:SET domain-containing protein